MSYGPSFIGLLFGSQTRLSPLAILLIVPMGLLAAMTGVQLVAE